MEAMRNGSIKFTEEDKLKDDKYVVFKRKEFSEWYQTVDSYGGTIPMALEDATVIRGQDLFAAPALDAYANSIAIAVKITGDKSLLKVADYFERRAEEARQIGYQIPDNGGQS